MECKKSQGSMLKIWPLGLCSAAVCPENSVRVSLKLLEGTLCYKLLAMYRWLQSWQACQSALTGRNA